MTTSFSRLVAVPALLMASLLFVPAVVAGSLAEARAWLADQQPDLILLDIGLPDGSGLELADELKHRTPAPSPPIVALSARVLAADRQAATEAGCDAFLAKPLRTADLLSVVAAHVGPPAPAGD